MRPGFAFIDNLFRRYNPGQRIVIVVVFIGIISAIISLVIWANRPEFSVLFSDLEPTGAARIVSDLRGMKVKYKLADNGRTIYVPLKEAPELRLKFADEDYPGGPVVGYEVFKDAKIGMTSFMQQLNMRRALEGELTKTINRLRGVQNSRVHLVLPEGSLFEEDKKGSASVVLYLKKGMSLSDEQVRGIAALVSNSVKGIAPEDVVVVDSEGMLLSGSQDGDQALGSVKNQWDLRHSVEARVRQKVVRIVEGIVGARNALVEVSVDLDFEQIEKTIEAYDPDNVVVVSEERHSETSSGGGAPQSNREDLVTNFELNKTLEHFVGNTGNIKRLCVAVLVNGKSKRSVDESGGEVTEYVPRTSGELEQIASLVKSTVGYNPQRGDVVEVRNLPFDRSALEADRQYFLQNERRAMWVGIVSKVLLGCGILIAFLLLKGLLKSSVKTLALMPTRQSIAAVGSDGGLPELPPAEGDEFNEDMYIKKLSPEAKARLQAKGKMTEEVINYAKENPEDAARLLRSWITENK